MSKNTKSMKSIDKAIDKFFKDLDKEMDELFDKDGILSFVKGSGKKRKHNKRDEVKGKWKLKD